MSIERPEWDAPYPTWLAYCEQLNAITFTVDKMELGFTAIMREATFSEREELALFARGFRGADPDMVIAALRARYEILAEAQDCGVDLKEKEPEIYEGVANRPLTPEDFNVFPSFEDAEA